MVVENVEILQNYPIAKDVWFMELAMHLNAKAGQFLEIAVPSYFLRRPISISQVNENSVVIIYKVVGAGTDVLSQMKPGEVLNVFGPLGKGFPIEKREEVLLVGGGVGVPPLYETARQYKKQGTEVAVVLGFNSAEDLFYQEAFEKLGCKVYIATMDGSFGVKGTVLDAIDKYGIQIPFVEACGPLPMLKALQNHYKEGYLSLEARMACGMGACMGCVVEDTEGHYVRVCKDGPVFPIGKVVL